MSNLQRPAPARSLIILILVLMSGAAIKSGYVHHEKWYRVLLITVPLLLLVLFRKHPSTNDQQH